MREPVSPRRPYRGARAARSPAVRLRLLGRRGRLGGLRPLAAPAPVVLTGATLLTDGRSPRLLLTGNGPLAPTLYNREGSTKVVIDVANAVAAPGLEPPRADGTLLSRLEMKSFMEMGKPHIQFELTAPRSARARDRLGIRVARPWRSASRRRPS